MFDQELVFRTDGAVGVFGRFRGPFALGRGNKCWGAGEGGNGLPTMVPRIVGKELRVVTHQCGGRDTPPHITRTYVVYIQQI